MTNEQIKQRIELMKAHADSILQIAEELEKALLPVSTGGNQNSSVLTNDMMARMLAKRQIKRRKAIEKAAKSASK